MLPDQMLDAVSAQATAVSVRKQDLRVIRRSLFQPRLQQRHDGLGQRRAPFLPSFAATSHMSSWTERQRRTLEAGQLRQPQTCLHRQGEQRMVASPNPGTAIGDRKQCFDLGVGEESDGRPSLALVGNGEHALDMRRERWFLEGGVLEERTNGGQTRIACAHAAAPPLLKAGEKGRDQIGVQVGKIEIRGTLVSLVLCKRQQEAKRVAIRGHGVGADLSLCHQPLGEEALQNLRECGRGVHIELPQRRSRRSAAWRINCGWADRYQ